MEICFNLPFQYVFISRNMWVLGSLKHIETTLIVLPKKIIEAIKGRGQDLEYNFTDVTRQVLAEKKGQKMSLSN